MPLEGGGADRASIWWLSCRNCRARLQQHNTRRRRIRKVTFGLFQKQVVQFDYLNYLVYLPDFLGHPQFPPLGHRLDDLVFLDCALPFPPQWGPAPCHGASPPPTPPHPPRNTHLCTQTPISPCTLLPRLQMQAKLVTEGGSAQTVKSSPKVDWPATRGSQPTLPTGRGRRQLALLLCMLATLFVSQAASWTWSKACITSLHAALPHGRCTAAFHGLH